jgi:N-acetylmuramoyl-L-alanine amidase CwlA
MAYVMKKHLANARNYGGKRNLKDIKYIVIHYTSNDGDTDENNGKYFAGNIVKASAHYFVDDDSITQSVPDDYVAWSVGGAKYASCATTGGGKFHGICTNSNSLSIEICDDVKNVLCIHLQLQLKMLLHLQNLK